MTTADYELNVDAGAKETDYPVDEEFSRLGTGEEVTQKPKQPPAQRERSSSKDADAQSSDAKDQDANLGVGKLTFVKCAVGSRPSSPPDEREPFARFSACMCHSFCSGTFITSAEGEHKSIWLSSVSFFCTLLLCF